MALINSMEQGSKVGKRKIHDPVRCEWTSFIKEGKAYLQLDTYGRQGRQHTDFSQTIQFGEAGAAELKRLISSVFPNLA